MHSSGAGNNFISCSLVKRLGGTKHRLKKPEAVRVANGEILSVTHYARLYFKMGNLRFVFPPYHKRHRRYHSRISFFSHNLNRSSIGKNDIWKSHIKVTITKCLVYPHDLPYLSTILIRVSNILLNLPLTCSKFLKISFQFLTA